MGETSGPEVVIYGSGDDEPVVLNPEEARVLGVLVEKQITTPDYYPLTLNGLLNGCNQTSSRDPVVRYDELTITRALDRLREKKLAFVFAGADSRVVKFGNKLKERWELSSSEIAALCVLLLRGPQTAGEIRNRSGRLHEFESLAEAESTLESLATRKPHPLAVKLPRQIGFNESRYAQLLSGPPSLTSSTPRETSTTADESPAVPSPESERIARLEAETVALRAELAELREQLAAFRRQFE